MSSAAKLTLPITLAGTLFVSAVGAGVTYGATTSRIDAAAEKIDATAAKVEGLEHEIAEQREWRARVETHLQYQTEALKRLESKP